VQGAGAPLQKQPEQRLPFDFLNPEDRLVLTLFPASRGPPEFVSTTHLAFTSQRILPKRALTNGILSVMIDCVHGANHTQLIAQNVSGTALKQGYSEQHDRAGSPGETSVGFGRRARAANQDRLRLERILMSWNHWVLMRH